MLKNHLFATFGMVVSASLFSWTSDSTDAFAQCGAECAAHAVHQTGTHASTSQAASNAASGMHASHHGGQISVAGPFCFEVVYRPMETRVYLRDSSNRPMRVQGVTGQMAMTVRGYEKVYRYPLKQLVAPAGSHVQDCLVLPINISRIQDGDMQVAFELSGLPNPKHPGATFTQNFAMSKAPLVTVVTLTEADRADISRQGACPVMGTELGAHGAPVKLLVGEQPLYLCCKGCIGAVQEKPETYLQKANPARLPPSETGKADKITVSTATTSDQAAIDLQQVCAVAGSRLGGMGTPVKVTIDGQSLFLCCKGCVGKVEKNPEQYLTKAAQLRARR